MAGSDDGCWMNGRLHYLTPDGIVIVQIDPKEYKELELNHLTLYQQPPLRQHPALFLRAKTADELTGLIIQSHLNDALADLALGVC